MRGRVDPRPAHPRRNRSQQPAARTGRHHLRCRHREHRLTDRPAYRRAPGADLPDRIREPAPGRHQTIQASPGVRVPFQPRERDPDRLGMGREPGQPAAHRLGRPTRRRGDPAPTPSRGMGQQRRPDHRDRIHPAAQHEPGQQHMRAAAPRGARTDPPPRPDPPHHIRGDPHEPGRRTPPRRQPLPALRASQLTRDQRSFNMDRIRTYAKQRTASERVRTALPASHVNASGEGRWLPRSPAAYSGHPHPDATRSTQTTTPATSSPPMTREPPTPLNRRDAQQG